MAPRASWKGYIKLSLVSCPVRLYPAVSASERISFTRVIESTPGLRELERLGRRPAGTVDGG